MVLRARSARRSISSPLEAGDLDKVIDRRETVLEMARRHVREGEERLARQIAIVAKLDRNAALAEVSEAIRISLDMSKRHLADLERRSKR